jgi:hypothetical protein
MEDSQPTISLNNAQKTSWNDFQTHLDGDHPTPAALQSFNTANPKSTLTPDHISVALNDVAAIKKNPDIAGMTPAYVSGNNLRYPVTAKGEHVDVGGNPSAIPKPNYDDPASRLKYAAAFTKKYGSLMQGRGDTPLRVNEAPDTGSAPVKDMAAKAASKYGLDPALLYSSAMEEGMSGLFPDKNGKVDFSGDEKHPISGYQSFGLDRFADAYPGLVKKGYLDKDFQGKFVPSPETNDKGEKVNSANFVDSDSALQAKAAMVKDSQDGVENFAKKNNIQLSPKAKEFFSLISYNAGDGNMRKMLAEYSKAGYLKDDSFIDKRPSEGWKQPFENVSRRLKMRDALKAEGLF